MIYRADVFHNDKITHVFSMDTALYCTPVIFGCHSTTEIWIEFEGKRLCIDPADINHFCNMLKDCARKAKEST